VVAVCFIGLGGNQKFRGLRIGAVFVIHCECGLAVRYLWKGLLLKMLISPNFSSYKRTLADSATNRTIRRRCRAGFSSPSEAGVVARSVKDLGGSPNFRAPSLNQPVCGFVVHTVPPSSLYAKWFRAHHGDDERQRAMKKIYRTRTRANQREGQGEGDAPSLPLHFLSLPPMLLSSVAVAT
ncbi:hypothetical protein PIB30_076978, partial [Stylosanthes scabra]|nr:hypothetical protein [Stylosanthes scabra]